MPSILNFCTFAIAYTYTLASILQKKIWCLLLLLFFWYCCDSLFIFYNVKIILQKKVADVMTLILTITKKKKTMFLNLIYYIKSCVLHTVCTHGSAQVFHFVQRTFTMDHIWFLINPYITRAYNQISLQICPHFVYRDRRLSNRTKDLPLQRKERKSNYLYHWHVITLEA